MKFPTRFTLRAALALLVLVTFAPLPGVEKTEKEEPPPRTLDEMRERIQKALEKTKVPGAGIALVTKDEVLWAEGIGLADVAAGTPATADTLFRIGSITKGFVALSALMLVEQGRLDLDAKLRDLAPEIEFTNSWEDTHPVLIAHLLEHTTGWDDVSLKEYASNDPAPLSLRDGLALNPKSRTCRWKPGQYFSYCNSGPAVAGYVIEKITGQRFEDFVEEHIFQPLGMNTASFFLTGDVQQRLAKGYGADGLTEGHYWHISTRPSGAINASAREMANFVRMMLNRGSLGEATLVSLSSIERMETPKTTLAAKQGLEAGYALANMTTVDDGLVFHGHDGGVNGYLSKYEYSPEHGVGFIVLVNSENYMGAFEVAQLVKGFLTRDLKKSQLATGGISAEGLRAHSGYYRSIAPRTEMTHFITRLLGVVRVEAVDGHLVFRRLSGKETELWPVDERRFGRREEPIATVMFLQDDEGRPILQAASGSMNGVNGNYQAVAGTVVWLERFLAVSSLLLMLSSVLFALIWIPRWLFGKLRGTGPVSARSVPLVSALCFFLAFGLMLVSSEGTGIIWRFGEPTAWSISFFVLTLLFPVTAAAGLWLAWRAREGNLSKAVRVHSLLVSAANLLVAGYLAYWGLIGVRTWT